MPPVPKTKRVRQKTHLREWRKFRGYSLEQACEMVEMSRENLGRIERGEVPYNQDILEQLAEAYNCEVADLIVRNPLDPEGIWSIWDKASTATKSAIVDVAKRIALIDPQAVSGSGISADNITAEKISSDADLNSAEKSILNYANKDINLREIANQLNIDERRVKIAVIKLMKMGLINDGTSHSRLQIRGQEPQPHSSERSRKTVKQ